MTLAAGRGCRRAAPAHMAACTRQCHLTIRASLHRPQKGTKSSSDNNPKATEFSRALTPCIDTSRPPADTVDPLPITRHVQMLQRCRLGCSSGRTVKGITPLRRRQFQHQSNLCWSRVTHPCSKKPTACNLWNRRSALTQACE
jgi:hypothetical protein